MRLLAVRHTVLLGMAVSCLMAAGCAGKGETRYLDLGVSLPSAQVGETDPVKIVIAPFEDRRPEKGRVGMRTHLWGGETNFAVAGERPGDVMAKALVDRLKNRGWRERPWNVRLAPAGSAADADIVISGQVQDLTANAKSRVLSTVITTTSRLVIQAKNLSDGSTTTRTVEGAQSRTVFWFEEEDVRALLAATIKDGIDRFINDTVIEQKALRPAR